MRTDDLIRLRHMLEAAREAMQCAEGKSLGDLDEDRLLSLALVRLVEIVGEAAAHVSEEGRSRIPGVPWLDIIGMRNRLVHAYFDIDMEIVWLTVVKFLPALVNSLKAVLDEGE
ncbi:MAG: HepT-like ribonuclease domain-containing protein [Thermodesulfobacteriota bacterium]